MYEIFHENKALLFPLIQEKDIKVLSTEQNKTQEVLKLASFINDWLTSKEQEDCTLDESSADTVKAALDKTFRMAPAAGGLVLVDNKIVVIDRNGIPDLPKGHIEKGETPEYAAIREVEEETGIGSLSIIKELTSTWHCYQYEDEWRLKRTYWYLMKTKADFRPKAQEEEGITAVRLIGKNDLNDFRRLTFRSIRETIGNEMLKIMEQKDGGLIIES